jgi:hypothetical protein
MMPSKTRCALLKRLQREREGSEALARFHGRDLGFQRFQAPPVVELASLSRCLHDACTRADCANNAAVVVRMLCTTHKLGMQADTT